MLGILYCSDVAGLRFDAAKHTYEDLLITISPDLQPDAAGQQAIIGTFNPLLAQLDAFLITI
jgi:hypothetical protein